MHIPKDCNRLGFRVLCCRPQLLNVLQAKLSQIVIFKEQSPGHSSFGFDSNSCQKVRVYVFCAAEGLMMAVLSPVHYLLHSKTRQIVCRVRDDVVKSLGLHQPRILISSFNRPNIYYEGVYMKVWKSVLLLRL